jgi:hypothetical protein
MKTPRTKSTDRPYYQIFPFGDDETYGGYPSAEVVEYGDLLTVLAQEWKDRPLGQYARHWLKQVKPATSRHVAATDTGGPERDFADLPLDYYAPASRYFYVRSRWAPQTTALLLQMGHATNYGHEHQDMGTFQLWRQGRWLSKESTGYSQQFQGGGSEHTIAHNGILFGGRGAANAYADGPPAVVHLQSRPDYAYAAIDLSPSYRAHASGNKARDDNQYAAHLVREFLFLRRLETLVILDRLEASDGKTPADQVVKSFLLHFAERPEVKGSDQVVGANGDQILHLTTLLPKKPEYKIVDEGAFQGRHLEPSYYQYRLAVNDSGQKQSYFLHVLQARGRAEPGLEATLKEDAGSWTVRLTHPTLGQALVVFQKGKDATATAAGYSASGTPNPQPLGQGVQSIQVTDQGPVWEK